MPERGFKQGDLVVLLQSLEWDDVVAIEGEICMIVEVFDPDDETKIFNFRLLLGDGQTLDVWPEEIRRIVQDEF
tara:strand:+ start:907 stop:1128 length:222 start_codon:yes stop_codon:yes gene_type:complete